MTTRHPVWAIALASALFIVSCGTESSGGGSGGGTDDSAMTVNDDNKNTAARSSAAGAEKAVESDAAPGRSLGSQGMLSWLQQHQQALGHTRRAVERVPEPVDISDAVCPMGGSAIYQIDPDNTGASTTVTIVYTDCADNWNEIYTVINGTADWTSYEDGAFTYVYDITTTTNDRSWSIAGTWSCDAEFSCTYTEEFTANGIDYRLENVSVAGDNSSGYDVSFRIHHPELGYIDVSGEDLIRCAEGGFSTGTITVTDGSNASVLSISFVSCTEMTVTFNANTEILTQ